jgi:hypothetical protein
MTSTPPEVSPPFSRYVAIVAAFGVAVYQATRGHWFEVAGLVGLGGGLTLLILAVRQQRPALRWMAWACFGVTLAAVVYVAQRDY